jgi:hypothetical protein
LELRLAGPEAAGGISCETASVFRHDHRGEDVGERIDNLMAAVIVPDDAERRARLAEHVAPDFVYVGPDGVFDGADGLGDAFAAYRRHGRRTTLRRTSAVEIHHGYFRFSWQRLQDGARAVEGWGFGALDDHGAIRRVVVFEGLAPGRGGR